MSQVNKNSGPAKGSVEYMTSFAGSVEHASKLKKTHEAALKARPNYADLDKELSAIGNVENPDDQTVANKVNSQFENQSVAFSDANQNQVSSAASMTIQASQKKA